MRLTQKLKIFNKATETPRLQETQRLVYQRLMPLCVLGSWSLCGKIILLKQSHNVCLTEVKKICNHNVLKKSYNH